MKIDRILRNKRILFLGFILLVAFFLRIYRVGNNPPGLTPDEAALGYNAYSILKTGRDEYGTLLPLIFKSFGDYKPGLYIYLTVPSVALLGLNETAVRLPSVAAGLVTVYLVYLLVKGLFKNEKLAFIAMAVAAINPWLIYFSRGAWEVNIALTLTLAGICFFLKSLERPKLLLVAVIFFALTLIDYQGAKLSSGIVVLLLLVIYRKELLKFKKENILLAGVVGLIISLPIMFSLFNGQAQRLTVFSVFSYPRPADYLQNFLKEGNVQKGGIVYDLFYNEPLNFLRGIMGRFFNHFSGRFLFFQGDWANPRHTPPNQGVLVIGDIIFLMIGIVAFLKSKITKEAVFVWSWLLLATLPSILSRDQVQAVRSFNLVIPLIIIIAFGINYVVENYKQSLPLRGKKVFVALIFGIYVCTYVYFLDAYFVHEPVHNSAYWQYGYKQMVEDIVPIQKNYKNIIIEQSYQQPYIYFLFYQKYDPANWQKQANLIVNSVGDVGLTGKLDNITFRDIDWSRDRGDHGDLVVADTKTVPPLDSNDPREFKLIDEIKFLNGKDTAWRILEVK